MRDYAKVAPQFWTGETGRQLRPLGAEVRVVATYLMTSPHANMLGLFYCPIAYIVEDTAIPIEGCKKALQSLSEVGFAAFDQATSMVWVKEMARFQIGERLERKDKRCIGIAKEYAALPNNPFLKPFFDRYGGPFHITNARGLEGAPQDPAQAPSMPGTGAGERTGAGKEEAAHQVAPPRKPNGAGRGTKVHGSADDYAMAARMLAKVREVAPSAKENNDGWANAIRLMREQDGHSHDEVWALFEFANGDRVPRGAGAFCWAGVILSPANLRAHWARIDAQRRATSTTPTGKGETNYGESGRI